MNVKVNYTVGIEEVPALVQSILNSCQVDLSSLSSKKLNTFELTQLIEEIVEIREKMSLIDSRLGDVANIVAGYYNARIKPEPDISPPQEPAQEPAQEPTDE